MLVKPRVKPDLTRHFDSVEVDVDLKDFAEYSRFKKAVLGRRGKRFVVAQRQRLT